MNFSHPMYNPGVVKNPFSRGGLARINMSHDTNISDVLKINAFAPLRRILTHNKVLLSIGTASSKNDYQRK
jgi:hypothetical protein